MTINLALEYIPRRMQELGFENDYIIRFRHFVLEPEELLKLEAFNQFFILVDAPENVIVLSDFGLFDLSFNKTNEQQYEHQGFITIQNYSSTVNHVRFIQVIPRNSVESSKSKVQSL